MLMLHMFRILKNTEMLTMQCTRWMVRIYSEIECQSSTVKEDVIEGKEFYLRNLRDSGGFEWWEGQGPGGYIFNFDQVENGFIELHCLPGTNIQFVPIINKPYCLHT